MLIKCFSNNKLENVGDCQINIFLMTFLMVFARGWRGALLLWFVSLGIRQARRSSMWSPVHGPGIGVPGKEPLFTPPGLAEGPEWGSGTCHPPLTQACSCTRLVCYRLLIYTPSPSFPFFSFFFFCPQIPYLRFIFTYLLLMNEE